MNNNGRQFGLILGTITLLVVVWLSSYYNFVGIQDHVITREQDQLLSLAETVARNVSDHFNDIEKDLEILANNRLFITQYNEYIATGVRVNSWRILEEYYSIQQRSYEEIGLVSSDGEFLYAYPGSGHDETMFSDVKALYLDSSKTVGEIFKKDGHNYIRVYRPINQHLATGVVLYVTLSMESLYNELIEPVRAGDKGYASVKDASGVIVMHPNSEDIGFNVMERRKLEYPDFDWGELEALVERQQRAESGVGVYHSLWFTEDASKRVKKFNAFSPAHIGDTFWIINISKDYDEVVAFLKWRVYGLVGANITVLVFLVMALFFYDRMVKNKKALKTQLALADEVNQLNQVLHRDLNKRQQLSNELQKSKEWYEGIFNGVTDGVLIAALDDRDRPDCIMDVNQGLLNLMGYDKQQMLLMRVEEMLSEGTEMEELCRAIRQQRDFYEELEERYGQDSLESFPIFFEMTGRRADGEVISIALSCRLMRYHSQWRAIIMVRDITQTKLERDVTERTMTRFRSLVAQVAERIDPDLLDEISQVDRQKYHLATSLERINLQLEKLFTEEVAENQRKEVLMIYQSRMAAMGEMLANIAHQWRQPLAVMHMIFNNMRDAYLHGELDQEMIEKQHERVQSLTQHMSRTIDDFRFFFNPQAQPKAFMLSHAIQLVTTLVEESIKHNSIVLSVDLQGDTLYNHYESQLAQVLLAILQNAIDALVLNRQEERKITVVLTKEAQQVFITIEDNAGGVPEALFSNLFVPYFTTKPSNKGTGLGLYISKLIINQHFHGTIHAKNGASGLHMQIVLPLTWEQGETI